MTYQEVWDGAHAIGFHKGRAMRNGDELAGLIDDQAFDSLLDRIDADWRRAARKAFDDGWREGLG